MTRMIALVHTQKGKRYTRTRVALIIAAVIVLAWTACMALDLIDVLFISKMRCPSEGEIGVNCAFHEPIMVFLAKIIWRLGRFALFGWPYFSLALLISLVLALLMLSVDLLAIRAGASRQMLRTYEWVIWIIIFGAVGYGVQRFRGSGSELVSFGGSSDRIANLEFRLRTNFPVTSVAWSFDGRYIATGSTMDRRIDIWDMSSRKIVKVLYRRFPPASFHEISWSPNGQYLAFCDAPGVLRVYRANDWKEARVLSGPRGNTGCTQSSFSSDSSEVALLATHYLGVYSVPEWQTLKAIDLDVGWGRGDLFNAVCYLPKTHTVLVGGGQYGSQGSWNGRVWFFGSSQTAPDRSINAYGSGRGDGGPVISLAADPRDRYIVTGAKTGAGNQASGFITESVHVLDALSGALIAAPLDKVAPLKFGSDESLAFTYDGKHIVVVHGGEDGWVHVLGGPKFDVIDLVRSSDFSYDVGVSQVRDEFAVGTSSQVIIWSLPDR